LTGVGAVQRLGGLGLLGADHQVLDLEASGVGVGDVVGHDVELAAKRHLARKADVERVVHGELTRAAGATNAPHPLKQPSCQLENVSDKTKNRKVNGGCWSESAGQIQPATKWPPKHIVNHAPA
jgi:hypothetical protein